MPIKKIPDVQSVYDLAPQFRNSCVGLFKCTRGGWVELLTNTLPASLQNSPTYTPTPLGGYEMVCTTSNEHVYWTYTDLRIPEFQPFTVISFIRDVSASNNNQTVFSVCNWSGVKGWTHDSRKGTTSDTGGTKSGIVDITYTNLELANVESFFSLRVGIDKKFKGFTDEGSQLTSGTNGFKTSGTINRVVIGANWRSSASSSYARCSIGPYVLVFDKALSDDQIEQASKNPDILFNIDKIRREYLTPTAGAPPAVTEIPPTLHGLDYQHAVIKAARIGGMLEQ